MTLIKCAVFGLNSNGEPDIYYCKVKCTDDQYDCGNHYVAAEDAARSSGYEPALVCDENDPAGAVMQLVVWESIPDPMDATA